MQIIYFIDNIFTTDYHRPISSGLLITDISDHFPIFSLLGNTGFHDNQRPTYILKRNFSQENKKKFRDWLSVWGETFDAQSNSIKEDCSRFRNEFRDAYNSFFPQKRVKVRKIDMLKPWLNNEILLSKVKVRA